MNHKNILVFKHMPSQNPGIFRQFAQKLPLLFTEIDLHAGDKIPDLSSFDGLWSMGGSMNVWEEMEFPWLKDEKLAIRQAILDLNLPFLGICLGHQLLAEAFGGKVEKTVNHEVGLFEIRPTLAGKRHPLLKRLSRPQSWLNVHSAEITKLPAEAIILAESDRCSNHIMQISSTAYSCQFHPELCDHTVAEWLAIPGIPEHISQFSNHDGLEGFRTSIEANLPRHSTAAQQLFENWLHLAFSDVF